MLADRDFRLWFLSRSLSVAGTAASAVALPLLTYQTSDSPALTAAVVGLEALPYLLFGLFAGAAADRLRRKAMMVGADLGCALLAKSLGVLTSWHVTRGALPVRTWEASSSLGDVPHPMDPVLYGPMCMDVGE